MSGPPPLINLTDRATIFSPDRGRVATFDREGRPLYYFRRGETFKRSLGSDVHLRFRRRARHRRLLGRTEAGEILQEVLVLGASLVETVKGEARRRLEEEVLPWTVESLFAESGRFRRAYQPVSILPPDQYRAIVVQATEGCSWNRCTFCNFYMDRPFRCRTAGELGHHLEAVKELLGKGARLRKGIFLADGNALALSNRRLEPLLAEIQAIFPDQELFGFVDQYSGERREATEWSHLKDRGLRRVYIGMETGLDELLEFVNKPGTGAELEGLVRALKSAGLQVSLILMIGLGGREYRSRHRSASRDLLCRLPLDSQDLIYLSPFIEHPGSDYTHRRQKAGLTLMRESEIETELQGLAGELRHAGLRVSRYDIREFIY